MDSSSNVGNAHEGNNRSSDLQWGSIDRITSRTTHDLFADFEDDTERINSPELPRLPTNRASITSRKNDRDESLASSSDAPLFSSDDLPSSSADNYLEHRRKRQHRRTWFEPEDLSNLSSFPKPSLPDRTPRTRGPFKRTFDSGVWFGSDETEEDEKIDLGEVTKLDVKAREGSELFEDEAGDYVDELNAISRLSQEDSPAELVGSVMQNIEDPGNSEGPVFPYWQKQPEDLHTFHQLQRQAQKKVQDFIDAGENVIDLS